MAFYGTLEQLLLYAPADTFHELLLQSAKQEPNSLETLMTEKVRCLSDILVDIGHDITARAKLSERVIQQIYQHYLYVKYYVLKLEQWPIGSSRAIEQRRSGLEKQLDALKQEKRAEQVKCWEDVAKLREEFRRWFKQYSDLRQRVQLVMAETSPRPLRGS